jgi:hypothetical protein
MLAPMSERICRRCHQRVAEGGRDFEVFEQMHWACFHFEFEHDDRPEGRTCADPSCPARATDPDPPPTWFETRR